MMIGRVFLAGSPVLYNALAAAATIPKKGKAFHCPVQTRLFRFLWSFLIRQACVYWAGNSFAETEDSLIQLH